MKTFDNFLFRFIVVLWMRLTQNKSQPNFYVYITLAVSIMNS